MQNAKQYIYDHIAAAGPVSFGNILRYAIDQVNEGIQDYQVASLLTELIQDYRVQLYDDGTSFVVNP